MSATGRKGKTRAGIKPRAARDYYPTPAWCVTRLLERIGPDLQARDLWRWCEPAVGNGAIVEAVKAWWDEQPARLQRHVLDFVGYDIEPQGRDVAVLCRKLIVGSFFESWIDPCDVMITNPPFVVCDENGDMVEGGLAFSSAMRGTAKVVIMLHRLDWLASAKRNEAIRADTPDVYVLPDRPSFTSDGSTDAQTYAWFVWGLSNGGRTEVLATTPIEERKAGKTMAPKSTSTTPKAAKPTKAPKAPKRSSAFDPDAFDDALDAKTGTKGGGKSKVVATDALERARAQAHEELAAERESKAKASSKKVTDAPAKKDVAPASTAKNAEGMRVSRPEPKVRLDFRLVEKFPKLIKVDLTADEAKKELERHAKFEGEIAGLQEKRKRDEKFVDAQLAGGDAVTKRARAEEILVRKKIIAADIGKLKALSTQALNTAANRFRWLEVECERRANDYDKTMHSFRLDTNEQYSVVKMSESERKDSDARRQVEMNYTGK